MKKEANALEKHFGNEIRVVATGIGIKRTVPKLLQIFRKSRPKLLIFTGSVSQIDLKLKRGDVVYTREWCFENGHCTSCDSWVLERLNFSTCSIIKRGISLNRPVLKASERVRLFKSTGAAVYDSATAAVLRTAQSEGIACLTPKIIAHTVGSGLTSFWVDVDQNMKPLANNLSDLLKVVENN